MLVASGSSEAQVQGVARMSEDGSHVCFVVQGNLTAALRGVAGIYRYDAITGTQRFVANPAPSQLVFEPWDVMPDGRSSCSRRTRKSWRVIPMT